MNNATTKGFISHLCSFLPDRREGKRGTKPIAKKKLVKEYMRLVKQGLQWRDIKHPTTVRRYITECQRRGVLMNYNTDKKKQSLMHVNLIVGMYPKKWRGQANKRGLLIN